MFQLTAPLREPTYTPFTHPATSSSCFNSRLPCGSRRYSRTACTAAPFVCGFQLTAPLREPTLFTERSLPFVWGFNSRLPCGSRLVSMSYQIRLRTFQLTAPLREPTILIHWRQPDVDVSTHGSLAGADTIIDSAACEITSFNSRLPCGSRHGLPAVSNPHSDGFNSRLPCGSRHCIIIVRTQNRIRCFNSRLPCGSRQLTCGTL